MTASDKPGEVTLNLDTLDLEAAQEFSFVVKGQRFTAKDPGSLDWRRVASFGQDTVADLRDTLGEKQFEKFDALKGVTGRHMFALTKAITEHYGFGDSGEGDDSSGS